MKIITFLFSSIFCFSLFAQNTEKIYLSGTGPENTKKWDFFCTEGRNSGEWTKIDVPSCWELQGFGTYNYGHDLPKADERGIYKRKFLASQNWKDKEVKIVFEGVMTDADVKINGESAGPIHQGAFYQFSYNITDLIKFGYENELVVSVGKMSLNESVNQAERKADYWVFGGIFRPVYIEIKPKKNIERVAIDAKANGNFKIETYLTGADSVSRIKLKVLDLKGNTLADSIFKDFNTSNGKVAIDTNFSNPKLWSPEFPHLYIAEVSLLKDNQTVHKVYEKFGFRTVELRKNDGIYVNDVRIMFKGVNRHSFHPETGRTTSKEMSILDVELMKQMNMNAVRMSHYPPDKHFLDVCDSLGLFVLDELAGWQTPAYDTKIGEKLVEEMVLRDMNHPSIILWDNGNEGGWNSELDDDFTKWDIQKRHVIHPWAIFDGTDTQHYKDYGYGAGVLFNGREVFFPTEFLHGLYDGGHGAGLEDYWRLMKNNPLSAGGFLWCLLDEAVIRTDLNDSLDSGENLAPDGILGPYREKEGSFYTIKEIWSPIQIHKPFITREFNGVFPLSNEYFYTNLNQCKFVWEALKIESPFMDNDTNVMVVARGSLKGIDVSPGQNGMLSIDLKDVLKTCDVLNLSAIDLYGNEVDTWTWPVSSPSEIAKMINSQELDENKLKVKTDGGNWKIFNRKISVLVNKKTGKLVMVKTKNNDYYIGNGPILLHKESETNAVTINKLDTSVEIVIEYVDKDVEDMRLIIHDNATIDLIAAYRVHGKYDYWGVGFDLSEGNVEGIRYLGDGPYRVWKNRLKGVDFGVWDKEYNNTITGQSWDYPEFKGYYKDFYWGELILNEGKITMVNESKDIYLRLFSPENGVKPKNTYIEYPKGDLSFMHAIQPIGTKFKKAENLGPMSEKNMSGTPKSAAPPYELKIKFYFE